MSGFVECFLIFCITITAIIAIVYDKNIKFKNRKSLDNIDEISVTLESNEEKKTKKIEQSCKLTALFFPKNY